MAGMSLFSPSWYRVQDLKPKLRRHVTIHRHDYRGKVSFILQDLATGRSHLLTPAAYRLIGLMDGRKTMSQLWDLVNQQLGTRAPTQDEAIRLMGQLHSADALLCDVPPDSRELFRRHQRVSMMQIKQRIWSPLAVRVPLWDPDVFLTRAMPFVAPLFSRWFLIVWILTVAAAFLFAAANFDAITENVVDRVLKPSNLFILWFVYPVVKTIHELAHGFAVKRNGGEVHEIGVMFLVLIPIPYVDASAASGFRDKSQRMLVGGVGIIIELFLAAIALFIWLNAEAGAVHAVAYNVMLIGGVSTLLFNGNPLLRFDGYYVLADWLEIPNLGTRANRHLGYVVQKYMFGLRDIDPITTIPAERFWFITYGIAAFVYRLFISFVIIAYIAGRFFIIGVLMAIWAATTQLAVPIFKGVSFIVASPKLRTKRPRAVLATLGSLAAIGVLLFVLPIPLRTVVEGVTWPSQQAQLRAGASGFVVTVLVLDKQRVRKGDPLIIVEDPFVQARLHLMDTEIAGLDLQRRALFRSDRVKAAVTAAELKARMQDRATLQSQIDDMIVRAPHDGLAVLPRGVDMVGRFLTRGEVVGYVVKPDDTLTVRTVIDQDSIDLVRSRTQSISAFPLEWEGEAYPAEIVREIPGGTMQLTTPALGLAGGGRVPVDPTDPKGLRTLKRVFEFDVLMESAAQESLLGRRVMLRFDQGTEPAGFQLHRKIRQLFLRLYSV